MNIVRMLVRAGVAVATAVAVMNVSFASARQMPRVVLTSFSESAGVIRQGERNEVAATLVSSARDAQVLVDIEIVDAEGRRVAQYYWDRLTVRRGRPVTLRFETPNTLPAGFYSYSVGIFSPRWKGTIGWSDKVQGFSILPSS